MVYGTVSLIQSAMIRKSVLSRRPPKINCWKSEVTLFNCVNASQCLPSTKIFLLEEGSFFLFLAIFEVEWKLSQELGRISCPMSPLPLPSLRAVPSVSLGWIVPDCSGGGDQLTRRTDRQTVCPSGQLALFLMISREVCSQCDIDQFLFGLELCFYVSFNGQCFQRKLRINVKASDSSNLLNKTPNYFLIDSGKTLTEISKELGMYKLFPNGKNKQKEIEDLYKCDDTDVLLFIHIIPVQLQLCRLPYCFLNGLWNNVSYTLPTWQFK